jgi:hypothetical protein
MDALEWMVRYNLRTRKVKRVTEIEREKAARIVLNVADIMQCSVVDLRRAFARSQRNAKTENQP